MTRRDCFGAIFGGAAATERPVRRNSRTRHRDEVLYRGSLEIPDEIVAHAIQSPLYRTCHRHEAVRFKRHGITWLFRELASTTRYAGEVVRTQTGNLRVHLFRVLPASRLLTRARITAGGQIEML